MHGRFYGPMNVRAQMSSFGLLFLAGCAIIPAAEPGRTPPAGTGPTPRQTEMPSNPAPEVQSVAALGETVTVGMLRVTPVKVLEDSRCPMNARCVWAGQVRLRLRVQHGAATETLEITSGKPLQISNGTLQLTEIRPDKVAGENRGAIKSSDYRFGFGFISGL